MQTYKIIKRIIFHSLAFILLITSFINPSILIAKELNETKDISSLENKVAKGYASKFCNAIGIGMSEQSAIKISIMENSKPKFNPSLWLELKLSSNTNTYAMNNDQLSSIATTFIVNQCGYRIGISKENEINEFKERFKSIKDEIDSAKKYNNSL